MFLCCFCGIKITSSQNNLDRHEKTHGLVVSKIQCAAKNCRSSFVNKTNYWNHWMKQHGDEIMPDFLNYCNEPNKEKRARKESFGREQRVKITKNVKSMTKDKTRAAHKDRNDAGEDEITRCERPNDFLNININIENTIRECLLRDPFYGHLTELGYSNHLNI